MNLEPERIGILKILGPNFFLIPENDQVFGGKPTETTPDTPGLSQSAQIHFDVDGKLRRGAEMAPSGAEEKYLSSDTKCIDVPNKVYIFVKHNNIEASGKSIHSTNMFLDSMQWQIQLHVCGADSKYQVLQEYD